MQYYAQLETSKQFCRNFLHSDTLLKKYSPKFNIIEPKKKHMKVFKLFFMNLMKISKKDGLCGGKGVTVQGYDFFDKEEQINSILESKDTYVIEENSLEKNFPF